jgi:hypothetical protein
VIQRLEEGEGVSFYTTAVIGVSVDIRKAERREVRPGCRHPVPEGAAFCPTCGAKTQVEVSIWPEAWQEEATPERGGSVYLVADWLFYEPGGFVGGYHDYGEPYFVLGHGVHFGGWQSKDGMERADLPEDPQALLGRLRELLTPFGVWDEEVEKSFGLWGCQHIRY